MQIFNNSVDPNVLKIKVLIKPISEHDDKLINRNIIMYFE